VDGFSSGKSLLGFISHLRLRVFLIIISLQPFAKGVYPFSEFSSNLTDALNTKQQKDYRQDQKRFWETKFSFFILLR